MGIPGSLCAAGGLSPPEENLPPEPSSVSREVFVRRASLAPPDVVRRLGWSGGWGGPAAGVVRRLGWSGGWVWFAGYAGAMRCPTSLAFHDGCAAPHFDWFLLLPEPLFDGDGGDRGPEQRLTTFRVGLPWTRWRQALAAGPIALTPLPPHRLRYLGYSGPIRSGERVTLVDRGTVSLHLRRPHRLRFRFRGLALDLRPNGDAADATWLMRQIRAKPFTRRQVLSCPM